MAIIGIDLGASNSAVAVLRGGRPVILPSAEGISLGGKAFPSYVALTGLSAFVPDFDMRQSRPRPRDLVLELTLPKMEKAKRHSIKLD